MWEKQKISHYDTNYILFGYFKARNFKNRMSYLKSTSSNLFICKILPKKKTKQNLTKFGTKNALFGYFLGRRFKKLLSYLKSTSLNFSIWKIFGKKLNKKSWNWDQKWLNCVFVGYNKKKLLLYLKSTARSLPICKILQKETKIPKFGPKNYLFGFFWPSIWKKLFSY